MQRVLILLCGFLVYNDSNAQKRDIQIGSAETCNCRLLTCDCCVSLDPQTSTPRTACLHATYLPADLTFDVDISANGQSVYDTKIGPGNFPICAPVFPQVCWAFNRIHFERNTAQICSEIRIGPITIFKVPCISYEDGRLVAEHNNY